MHIKDEIIVHNDRTLTIIGQTAHNAYFRRCLFRGESLIDFALDCWDRLNNPKYGRQLHKNKNYWFITNNDGFLLTTHDNFDLLVTLEKKD